MTAIIRDWNGLMLMMLAEVFTVLYVGHLQAETICYL